MKSLFCFLALWIPLMSFAERSSSSAGGFFSAEALFWVAKEEGLGFANEPADVLSAGNFTQNPVYEPSFEWKWGFRVGANYTQEERQWSYQAFWTKLESHAHGEKSVNTGAPDFKGIFPVWSMGPGTVDGDYVSSASSAWNLTMNLVDLHAQYRVCLGEHCKPISPLYRKDAFANRKKKKSQSLQEETTMSLGPWLDQVDVMPFLGVRMAALNQKLSVRYEGGTFLSGVDLNTLKCDFQGGGPRLGLMGQYSMARGFSLFARAAVAPLYGQFDLKLHETYLESVRHSRSNLLHHWLLSADGEAGIEWKRSTAGDWMSVIFRSAWEGQAFIRGNRFFRGPFFFHKIRNLFLQGLTLSSALEF